MYCLYFRGKVLEKEMESVVVTLVIEESCAMNVRMATMKSQLMNPNMFVKVCLC